MFERYTAQAKRAVFFAKWMSDQYNAPDITPEHLLLGLIKADGKLFELLSPTAKESAEILWNRIIFLLGKAVGTPRTESQVPLSHKSKLVLAYAASESEKLTYNYIGTEHLLIGIIKSAQEDERSFFSWIRTIKILPYGQILEEYGLTADLVRHRVKGGSITDQNWEAQKDQKK